MINTSLTALGRSILSVALAVVLVTATPLSVVAQEVTPTATTPTSETTTQPVTTTPPVTETVTQPAQTPGPQSPTGPASNTFVYNPDTGLWENDYYVWNPKTKQTTPKTPQSYSYNPDSGKWDTTQWQYNPASGKYEPNTYTVAQPPAGAPIDQGSLSTLNNLNNATFNGFYNNSISNASHTVAQSGGALVSNNTGVGNIGTGDATAITNLFNMLQSSASFLGGNAPMMFNADIQGNLVGDILINPDLANGGLQTTNANSMNNLAVNQVQNNAINNQLTVDAASGNAVVTGNTSTGNVKTGDANAIANVFNLLNSSIGAGKSFLGAINIYGNLNGDILLPPGFLDTVLATNGPNSPINANNNTTTNVTANETNNQTITNNITSNANTGNANVGNNTSTGNIGTGNALSNVTLLNMTGHDVIGANDLLVFVNVLGKWVGVIMDPANMGITAASVGGGITQNNKTVTNAALNSLNNSAINNDINVNATSGNADVSNNTHVGDVTTGNATTSVNLANFINSHLDLSSWFGVLFINVFGSWNGSFGLDTSAGDSPAANQSNSPDSQSSVQTAQVFKFVPAGQSGKLALQSVNDSQLPSNTDDNSNTIGSGTTSSLGGGTPSITSSSAPQAAQKTWMVPVAGFIIAACLLLAERFASNREQRRAKLAGTTIAAA